MEFRWRDVTFNIIIKEGVHQDTDKTHTHVNMRRVDSHLESIRVLVMLGIWARFLEL